MSNPIPEVVIDLETLDVVGSKKRMPVILSIGAVSFDPAKVNQVHELVGDYDKFEAQMRTGKPFANYSMYYTPVSLAESLRLGFTTSPDTIKFWQQQKHLNQMEQSAAFVDKLVDTLKDFASWLKQTKAKKVWANAPTFDITILREAFDMLGLGDIDIYFRSERDVRTAIDITGVEWIPMPDGFIKHNAICDAVHEAMMIQRVYAKIAYWRSLEEVNKGLHGRIEELAQQLAQSHGKHGIGCEE